MIVLVFNVIVTIAFIIALLWTVWGTYRLTQQIKRLTDEAKKNLKE